jgi:hypothetical protein
LKLIHTGMGDEEKMKEGGEEGSDLKLHDGWMTSPLSCHINVQTVAVVCGDNAENTP